MSLQPSRSIILLLLSVFILIALSACGQKGDLYHPGEKQSAVEPAYPIV